MLKKIECYVQPGKLDAVRDAMLDLGVDGMSVSEIKGFGRERGFEESSAPRPEESRTELKPEVRQEARPDARRKPVVPEWVEQAAATSTPGDWLRPDGLPTVRVNPVVRPASNQLTA